MEDPVEVVEDVSDHPALETTARVGYAVNGVIHLLIAWIAGRVALGAGGEADQGGALASIAQAPLGGVLLWIGVVGFAGLAGWQLLESIVGEHANGRAPSRWADRLTALAKGVTYLALGWTTWQFASGSGRDSSQTSTDVTTALMSAPLGQLLVGAVGLVVILIGGYHVDKGVRRRFLRDLEGNAPGTAGAGVRWAGAVGYVAKGVALGVVGALFLLAAWQHDPDEATGLDGALTTMAQQPFGPVLLLAVALGFAAFGIYSVARARYVRL